MAFVITDQIRDSQLMQDEDKLAIERSIMVGGLTDSSPNRLAEAKSSCGVSYGDAHPTQTACRARKFVVRGVSSDACLVIVTYESAQFGGGVDPEVLEEWSATLRQEPTDTTLDGDPLLVWYYENNADIGSEDTSLLTSGKAVRKVGTTTVFRPFITMHRLKYHTKSGAGDTTIENWIKTFTGRVNSDTWRDGAAHTWLCHEVKATQYTITSRFRVDFTFIYRPEGWYNWTRLIHPDGTIRSNQFKNFNDVDLSNGWRRDRLYPATPFGGLPF